MSRTLWPLAALAMLAVIVAGCGNGSAGTGSGDNSTAAAPVGTGSRGSNSTTASHNSTATAREKAVKFAECIRAHGVSDRPGREEPVRIWGQCERRGVEPGHHRL